MQSDPCRTACLDSRQIRGIAVGGALGEVTRRANACSPSATRCLVLPASACRQVRCADARVACQPQHVTAIARSPRLKASGQLHRPVLIHAARFRQLPATYGKSLVRLCLFSNTVVLGPYTLRGSWRPTSSPRDVRASGDAQIGCNRDATVRPWRPRSTPGRSSSCTQRGCPGPYTTPDGMRLRRVRAAST